MGKKMGKIDYNRTAINIASTSLSDNSHFATLVWLLREKIANKSEKEIEQFISESFFNKEQYEKVVFYKRELIGGL